MRFIANLTLLAAALVAGGCSTCGHNDCCEQQTCCGGCGHGGYGSVYAPAPLNGGMVQPVPEAPMEPAEEAPAPPAQ
jgi:hypothetical protein